jgi:mono/diheme cytochrome c family protein
VRKAPAALAVLTALAALGCDPDYVVHHVGWFATMRHQRSVKPYSQPARPPVAGTVPVTGAEPDSLPAAVATRLGNPRTRTAESLNRGKWVYETYCLVCHGAAGKGDGPISATAGGPFPGVRDLTDALARSRSDGYLYGVVTYAQAMGRGLMPRYGDKIHGSDRWDVVNYVRQLQQQAPGGGGPR